jgi:hypothetical protein
MAGEALICYHSSILSYAATWSLAVGSADSAFPLTNLNSVYAHKVSKTTGTTATYRGTISSTAIQAIAVINCNLAGLTLTITNNGGMASQNLVIPAAPADNLSINGWVDLRAVTTAGTQWNVAIAGAAANIAVGKILLISSLVSMPLRLNLPVRERKPTNVKRTHAGIALGNRKAVRYRTWLPDFAQESNRASYTTLRRGSEGPTQPFLFLLDYTVNDPAYAWFPDDEWQHMRVTDGIAEWSDRIEECNPGTAL